jgi:hypothetical protein
LLSAVSTPPREVEDFVNALRFSGLISVDAFLEKRPEFLKIGKAAMAVQLLHREQHDKLWKQENNWMTYLYGRMMTNTLEEFSKNNVSFITYNYDRSLEEFLCTSLSNAFGKDISACAAVLTKMNIIHLHGRLGYLPWQDDKEAIPYGAPIDRRVVDICVREIKIVHEDITDRDKDFKLANQLLGHGSSVYVLGFGYGPKNLERLHLKNVSPNLAQGSAQGIEDHEMMAIGAQCGNRIQLFQVDCLTLLRQRADLV